MNYIEKVGQYSRIRLYPPLASFMAPYVPNTIVPPKSTIRKSCNKTHIVCGGFLVIVYTINYR